MAAGAVIDRAQRVACVLDVLDGKRLIGSLDRRVGLGEIGLELLVIGGRLGDRLLEDRRIGRDAGQAVLLHQLLEAAFVQELAIDEIEPDGLTGLTQRLQTVGHAVHFPITSWATLTTFSTVKPNFFWRSLSGAEAPKLDMVTVAPSEPT